MTLRIVLEGMLPSAFVPGRQVVWVRMYVDDVCIRHTNISMEPNGTNYDWLQFLFNRILLERGYTDEA